MNGVNIPTIQTMQAMSTDQLSIRDVATATSSGDTFGQLLEQMGSGFALTSLPTGQSDLSVNDLLFALNQTGDSNDLSFLSLFDHEDLEDNDALMEFLSQLIANGADSTQIIAMMSNGTNSSIMQSISNLEVSDNSKLMLAMQYLQNSEKSSYTEQAAQTGEAFALVTESDASSEQAAAAAQPQAQGNTSEFDENQELSFLAAVHNAKKVAEQTKGEASEVSVTSAAMSSAPQENVGGGIDAAASVTEQTVRAITTQVNANAQENSAFTVKLSPEGLGEVIVKFEKTSEGMTLSMLATDPKTAQMLNNSMQELQMSLAAYNAKINEVEVTASESASQFSNFNQQYRNNSENRGNQQNNSRSESHPQSERLQTYPSGTGADRISVLPSSQLLNTYI